MAVQLNNIGEYKKREGLNDPSSLQLSKQEIEFLLIYISQNNFPGIEIEPLFYLVNKLQAMYPNAK